MLLLHVFHLKDVCAKLCVWLCSLHWRKGRLTHCSTGKGAIITGYTAAIIKLFISADMPSRLCGFFFFFFFLKSTYIKKLTQSQGNQTQSALYFTAAWNVRKPKKIYISLSTRWNNSRLDQYGKSCCKPNLGRLWSYLSSCCPKATLLAHRAAAENIYIQIVRVWRPLQTLRRRGERTTPTPAQE